jgi:hypothetical protein
MTREQLLDSLQSQLDHLSSKYRIPGMTRDDVRQQLIVKVLEDYDEYGNDETKKVGWWFKRLDWYAQRLVKRSKNDPLNNSVESGGFF